MNALQRSELWSQLRLADIVNGDLPDDDGDMSPWYVRAMVGIAAWFAALFLVMAIGVGLTALLRNATATAVAGLAFCAAAIGLMRAGGNGVFTTQLALAGSLAGQSLVAYALLAHYEPGALLPWILLGGFELILIVAARDYIHRVLAALAALFALCSLLGQLGWGALFPAMAAAAFAAVQLNEAPFASRSALWQPVSVALALATLLASAHSMFGVEWLWLRDPAPPLREWAGALAVTLVLLATVLQLVRHGRLSRQSSLAWWGVLAALALLPAAWSMTGLATALIVLLVAFATGHRPLLGVAALALLGVLGHYYYSLQATLLLKSAALLATGMALLGVRYVLHLLVSPAKEIAHE